MCESVRDLGVIVHESLTHSNHIAKITTTAHHRVSILLRSFTSRDVAILVKELLPNNNPICKAPECQKTSVAIITYVRPLLLSGHPTLRVIFTPLRRFKDILPSDCLVLVI